MNYPEPGSLTLTYDEAVQFETLCGTDITTATTRMVNQRPTAAQCAVWTLLVARREDDSLQLEDVTAGRSYEDVFYDGIMCFLGFYTGGGEEPVEMPEALAGKVPESATED